MSQNNNKDKNKSVNSNDLGVLNGVMLDGFTSLSSLDNGKIEGLLAKKDRQEKSNL